MQVTITVREQQVEDVEANFGSVTEQREYIKAAIYESLSEATAGLFWRPDELRYCPKDPGEVVYSITVEVEPIMEEIMESPDATQEWREQMLRVQEANLQAEVEMCFWGAVYPPEVDGTGWEGWVA